LSNEYKRWTIDAQVRGAREWRKSKSALGWAATGKPATRTRAGRVTSLGRNGAQGVHSVGSVWHKWYCEHGHQHRHGREEELAISVLQRQSCQSPLLPVSQ
jgi:hypothetical protein